MKKILLLACLLSSFSAHAKPNYNINQQCDFKLNSDLIISPVMLKFHIDNAPLYRIENANQLYVNNKKVVLSVKQKQDLADYDNRIRVLIPEIKEVVINSLDLAANAVNLSFTELLGKDNTLKASVNAELALIKDKINTRFDTNKIISIDQEGRFINDFVDNDFEQRFEKLVQKTLAESMGAIIQGALFSGEDISTFSKKMERFGKNLEVTMEAQGKILETKADTLCLKVQKLDGYETALQKSIPALSTIDTFSIKK